MVDTGSSYLAVSERLATDLHHGSRRRIRLGTPTTGESRFDVVDVPEIKVGGATVPGQEAIVLTMLDKIGPSFGTRVDGVLGAPLFLESVVVIDYRSRLLDIRPPSDPVVAKDVHYTAIEISGDRPWVDLDLCGSGTDTYLLDTGAAIEVSVGHESPLQRGVLNLRKLPRVVRSSRTYRLGRLHAFGFAGTRFDGVWAALLEQPTAGSSGGTLLGSGLFVDSVLVLDYPRQRVGLRRAHSRYAPRGGWGIAARYRGEELQVVGLVAGGPAVRAGVRRGDVIVAVDKVVPDSVSMLYSHLSRRNVALFDLRRAGEHVRLEITRSVHVPLVDVGRTSADVR